MVLTPLLSSAVSGRSRVPGGQDARQFKTRRLVEAVCGCDLYRRILALGTAQRNIAAALVVASQSFSNQKVVVMVVAVAIVGLVSIMPFGRVLGAYNGSS